MTLKVHTGLSTGRSQHCFLKCYIHLKLSKLSETHKMVWIGRDLQDHPVLAPLSGTGAPSTGIHFWILQIALTSGGGFKLILAVSIAVWYLGERKGVLT